MKGIIRNKHLYVVIAIVAVLACLVGVMQIRRMPSENAISGVVYQSEQDHWKDSGYTLALGASLEVLAADFAEQSQVIDNLNPYGKTGPVAHLKAGNTLTLQI